MTSVRLWTDAEIEAAHSLARSVMTPAEPLEDQDRPLAIVLLTPKRSAFENREHARRRQIRARKAVASRRAS